MPAAISPTLVVGGGIGGLGVALAIARTGREVHLLERAPEFVEIGAGLQMGPNAIRMLDRLGVLDAILEVAVTPANAVMRHAVTGEELTVLQFGQRFEERFGYPYAVMHRSDLLAILLDACRAEPLITLENSKVVEKVESTDEDAAVLCTDGSRYRGEVLVGADGIRSTVRTLLDTSEPRASGYVAYRGTLPFDQVKNDVQDNNVVLWIGPGIHLVQYPVRRYELYNQVAVFKSARFALQQEPYGTVEELRARFAQACPEVQNHMNRVSTERSWPVFDRDPMDNWIAGRAVLMGDAAHPMLQFLGQGACQALEDAVVLADELAAHPTDLGQALVAYQSRRLTRTTRCQLIARPWGEVWHTEDPDMLAQRNRILGSRRHDDYSELEWLYGQSV